MKDYTIMDDAAAVASSRRMSGHDVLDMVRFAAGMMCVPAMMLLISAVAHLI